MFVGQHRSKSVHNFGAQLDALILRFVLKSGDRLPDDLADINPFKMKRGAASFESRIVQKGVDHIEQRVRVSFHACHGLVLQWSKWQLFVTLKQLTETHDDIQRRSQLMRNV